MASNHTIERRPSATSIRLPVWPNYLGDTPEDALGKRVKITDQREITRDFVVSAISGCELFLETAH